MIREDFLYKKISTGSISSVKNLVRALCVDRKQFFYYLSIPEQERFFKRKKAFKSDGGDRDIYSPSEAARVVQKSIKDKILANENIIKWPIYLFGTVKNNHGISRDYIACSALHCNAKSILKLDIKDFYGNIHYDLVFAIFKNFLSYPQDVSEVLTECCLFQGSLPQGGLTSSYLASLCLWDIEPYIAEILYTKGYVYTRYVDDITVSSKKSNEDFAFCRELITSKLLAKNLPVNHGKTKIISKSSNPLIVHGILVNNKNPQIPREELMRIRAAAHQLQKLAKQPNMRTSIEYRKLYNSCVGRVNKLSRVNHPQHKKLIKIITAISPLPSKKDIDKLRSNVAQLKFNYKKYHHTYWYYKKFWKTRHLLKLVKKTFPLVAGSELENLKIIKPTFRKS